MKIKWNRANGMVKNASCPSGHISSVRNLK